MKKPFIFVLSFLVVISFSVCMILLAYVPATSLWKEYVVLYASKEIPEESVLEVFQKNDAAKVITLSEQSLPAFSKQIPSQLVENSRYISSRKNYFFDKNNNIQLYYIPENYAPKAKNAVNELINLYPDFSVGLDLTISYPFVVPVLCFLAFIGFIVLSKKKLYMAFAGLFPVLFSVCLPVYTGGAAAVLFMYAFYLAGSLWNRKNMLKVISKTFVIVLFFIVPLPIAFTSSLRSGLMFLMVYAGTLALIYLLYEFSQIRQNRRRFVPVPMFTASMIPVLTKKTTSYVLIPVVVSAVFCFFCIFNGYLPSSSNTKELYIPAPAEYTDETSFNMEAYSIAGQTVKSAETKKLPGLVDYLVWTWNTMAFPYKSLNNSMFIDKVLPGDVIGFSTYSKDSRGTIIEAVKPVYIFDDEFINAIIGSIDNNSSQIELLLKNQGGFINMVYADVGRGSIVGANQPLIILSLLFAMFIPAVVIFIWRIKK